MFDIKKIIGIKDRTKTNRVAVGNVFIGGDNNVVIQSMTTTKTSNVEQTIKQINQLHNLGCEIVRVAVFDVEDSIKIKEVVQLSPCPIIADIHFNPDFAIKALEAGVSKIRLNPGNISDKEKLKIICDLANKKNVPIRIGVNSGSLPRDIITKYGISVEAMITTAKNYIKILNDNNFNNIILSFKSSNALLGIDVYLQAAKEFSYPLHIGITEAGSIFNGTVKSCAGLAPILLFGIGNTIRISLTGDPIEEVKVCKKLLSSLNLYNNMVDVISCPTCGRLNFNLEAVVKEIEDYVKNLNFPLKVAILGCAVNGPGEAMDADIGIAGSAKKGIIFENGKIIKTVPEDKLVDELKKLIDLKYKMFINKN